jgi:hypothetical protein
MKFSQVILVSIMGNVEDGQFNALDRKKKLKVRTLVQNSSWSHLRSSAMSWRGPKHTIGIRLRDINGSIDWIVKPGIMTKIPCPRQWVFIDI